MTRSKSAGVLDEKVLKRHLYVLGYHIPNLVIPNFSSGFKPDLFFKTKLTNPAYRILSHFKTFECNMPAA